METKFTKGPWSISDEGCCLLISGGNGDDIATCSGLDPDNTGFNCCSESAANANLIKAAPKMYEMLEKIKLCIEWGYSDSELANELSKLNIELIATLAEARGE